MRKKEIDLVLSLDKKLSTSLNCLLPLTALVLFFRKSYMEKDQKKLWENILASLETEISRANFLTLFRNTSIISLDQDSITIAAQSSMIIDLIQKRFLDTLTKTIAQHVGHPVQILFIPKIVSTVQPEDDDSPLFAQEIIRTKLPIGHLPRVRPDFTFQNIAVSSSNQLAFVSATTVAKNPGSSYNPLFIYGPTGVGKTHLMQAIANEVYSQDPNRKIIYTTSEEFTNEVVEAIRSNQTQNMKKRFRNAALLIIDDVQFLAGKDKVQEELFHTFNILMDHGAQIVLSSDRPPHEIKKLEARLSSRFSGGLTVDVEEPDFELKTAILLIKAKKFGVDLPINVAKIIAESVTDTRTLEGVLLRVITEASSMEGEITEQIATRALNGKKPEQNHFHADDIIKSVCEYYDVKPTQIKGPKRDASLVRARQIIMYLLKTELKLPLVEIGNALGGRDHTTIMYGVEKMGKLVLTDERLHEEIMGITKTVRG